jgi:orotidine-5'-phosphate decarboxylase
MAEKLLYVGLDQSDLGVNRELAQGLVAAPDVEGNFGFKINQDDAFIGGADYISSIVDLGKPVFVDLKMNNGPRTMSRTIRSLADLGVSHTNVWAHAESNLKKTMEQIADVEDRPGILAVTFYTRWKEDYARKHHNMSLEELIEHMAHVGVENGADGLILPGNMLHTVSGLDVVKLNPAVRVEGEETDSQQEQTSTPFGATVAGSDILVVGSPIYKAPEPVEALKLYLGEQRRGVEALEASA